VALDAANAWLTDLIPTAAGTASLKSEAGPLQFTRAAEPAQYWAGPAKPFM